MISSELNDLRADTRIADGLPHGFQLFKGSPFYSAFAVVVDDHGALLSLLRRMIAYPDQCVDDMIKGIVIIVKNDQIIQFRRTGVLQNFRYNFFASGILHSHRNYVANLKKYPQF